ncbi:septum formation family protein [Cellulomonas sp. P5_C5]
MMRSFTYRVAAPVLLAAALAGVSGCSVLDQADPPVRDETSGEITESSEADVFSLKVGDCLNQAASEEETEVSSVPTVPCAEPHDSEAYAATDLPEGDYPGDASVTESADTYCYDEFATFIGLSYDESALDLASFYPTQESWAGGDREIMCFVSSPDGQVTGTLAAAAR